MTDFFTKWCCGAWRASIIVSVVVGFSLASLTGCGEANLTDAEYVQRAKDYQGQGDIRASVIELKNALQQNPDNSEARWLLGQTYLEIGNGAAAEKELVRARELGFSGERVALALGKSLLLQRKFKRLLAEIQPIETLSDEDNAEIHVLRGMALLSIGNRKEASEEVEKASKLSPSLTVVNIAQARLAVVNGQFDDARSWAKKALEGLPQSGEAWGLMGDLERHAGNKKAAEDAYGKAIKARLNNFDDYYRRAVVRISQKDYAGALSDIEILQERAPFHPAGSYALGLLRFEQKKYAEAQTALEQALKYSPDYLYAIFYLGASHFAQSQFERAESYLRRYLSKAPASDEGAMLLGTVRLRKKDYSGALAVLLPALERNPDNPMVLDLVGRTELANGNIKAAMDYLQKAVDQQPQSATARVSLGLGLLVDGERAHGINELEAAIKLDPQNTQIDNILIVNYLRVKQFDQAIEAAERLRLKTPNSPDPLNLLGIAYGAKGDENKAKELFSQALDISPGNPTAGHGLARLELKAGDSEKARALLEEVLKHHPGNLATLLSLAEQDARQGDVKKVQARLEQAKNSNPTALQPRLLLARLFRSNGNARSAVKLLREVEVVYPNNPALLAELGNGQLIMGDVENAVTSFKKALRKAPNSVELNYFLAEAYGKLNDIKKVRDALEVALKLKSDYFPAQIAMVRLLAVEGKDNEANQQIKVLRRIKPDSLELLVQEGWLAMRQNRSQDAVAAYKAALVKQPRSVFVINLSQALLRADGPEAAEGTLRQWLKEHPSDARVHFALGQLLVSLNRNNDARIAYERVIQLAPNNAIVLNNLAWLLGEVDLAKALEYSTRAIKIAPDSPEIMDTYAMLLASRDGQTEQVIRLLRSALQKAPDALAIQHHLAMVLAGAGNKKEARQLLEKVVSAQRPFSERDKAQALLKELGG